MERHHTLHRLARGVYRVPGARGAARVVARALIQRARLGLTNRQRVYNFFAADTAPAKPVRVSVRLPDGRTVRAELDLREDMDRHWYFWGYAGYEPGVPELVWRLARERQYRTVVEVGANIGYFTLYLAAAVQAVADGGRVIAFEPFPPVLRQLEANVRLNPDLPVTVEAAAVSAEDGVARLFVPADAHARTNASLVAGLFDQKGATEVPAVRLDTYLARHEVGKVDLLKLDCEGAEPMVLRGAERLLAEGRPDVICEVLPATADELERLVSGHPYRRYLITDSGPVVVDRLAPHERHRDYLLTVRPL